MAGIFGKVNGPLCDLAAAGGVVYSTDTFKGTASAAPSAPALAQAQDAKHIPVSTTEENIMFIF
jgi:hypothetical protein